MKIELTPKDIELTVNILKRRSTEGKKKVRKATKKLLKKFE